MRHAQILLLLLCVAAAAQAGDMTTAPDISTPSPGYQFQRYNEGYSCFSNTAARSDPLDTVKYISLRPDEPSWYLTFGGELRERFEGNDPLNFGIGGTGSDSYLLQRATLLTDLHLGDRVRFFAEGISGLMEGESYPAPPAQYDAIDLEFAFLDLIPYLTPDEKLIVRTGRFGLSFGAGRLVDTRPPVNIDFRFDGIELIYTRPLWAATAFFTQPARDSGGFDGEDHATTFWGLYTTHWFDPAHKDGVDLYYFGIHRQEGAYASGTGDERRHTMGTRQFGGWNGWDWNTEEAIQAGSFAHESILAWTASLDAGHSWTVAGRPRLGLKADITSGNTDPNGGRQETFDALYFKSGYFNDASLLRPENIIDIHPNASVHPAPAVAVDGGADAFWRYSRNDAVYAVPGFVAVPGLPAGSSYVGTALDVNLNWQLQRHLNLQASFVHFISGTYVRQAGGRSVNYISTTLDFIF